MDVTALQSFLPAGIAWPVRILWSSGKMAIATLPPILQKRPRSKIPRSIRSRRPRERPDRYWSAVNEHWLLFRRSELKCLRCLTLRTLRSFFENWFYSFNFRHFSSL